MVRPILTSLVALILLPFALACAADDGGGAAATEGTAAVPESPAGTARVASGSQGGADTTLLDIPAVVARVRPAVVSITNEQVQLDRTNEAFTVPAGVGTGFIYDSTGFILTNNHVIEGARSIRVTLADGRSLKARLVGGDARTDLAVLKVDAPNLPALELGDSEDLEVGQWVIAIGNALGLQGGPTVTVGVVSALDRTVQEPAEGGGSGPFLFDLIQTNAAINPGNSGGPLLDLQGRVIGINTLVAGQVAPGIQAQGIGFAIAIGAARPIADSLEEDGRVEHAYLGVQYTPLNAIVAAQIGAPTTRGVVVINVEPRSPASAALQAEDLITKVDGVELDGESALAEALFAKGPGDRVTLTIVRGGAEREVQVTLGEAPN